MSPFVLPFVQATEVRRLRPSLDEWMREIEGSPLFSRVGMVLVHRGVVRGTSRDGREVRGLRLSFSEEELKGALAQVMRREGIYFVRAWINEGELKVGDDIMMVLVAGRFRSDVLPALSELVEAIKSRVVREEEMT